MADYPISPENHRDKHTWRERGTLILEAIEFIITIINKLYYSAHYYFTVFDAVYDPITKKSRTESKVQYNVFIKVMLTSNYYNLLNIFRKLLNKLGIISSILVNNYINFLMRKIKFVWKNKK